MQFAALRSQVGAHPHNWPIQIAAEWGIPATVILLVLIIAVGRRIARCPTPVVVAGCCAISAALVLGLVDGNLVMPVSQTAFALAVGVVCGLTRDNGPKQNQPGLGIAMAIAALLFATGLAVFTIESYPSSEADRIEFQRAYPDAGLLPRFWAHGFL